MNANGAVIYRGPSLIDGAPIVAIVTGLKRGSRNSKTGDMLQTWILREDVGPVEAAKSGLDHAVCGDCLHRPVNNGSCYVNLGQAPRNVWKAYQAGAYLPGPRAFLGHNRFIRLGSYGDPAAVPLSVWRHLTAGAAGWNGYTHQWRTRPDLQPYCMASVDSSAEAVEARNAGWRTFRVRESADLVYAGMEFVCPASAEAGHKTQCAECKACGGTSSKAKASPVIIAHGAKAKRFNLSRNEVPA